MPKCQIIAKKNKKMILINNVSTDPFFNLAAEEYLVKNIDDEVFMIWENSDCLVVGKHQNAVAEINFPFVWKNNIPVIRRISGGGTVFQGTGNINFSVIRNVKEGEDKIDFAKHSKPVIQFLKTLGLNATLSGKSSIAVDGLKVSGNAAHLHRNRSLHHGTLLYNADLLLVKKSIDCPQDRYLSKAVASNRAEITNVFDHLNEKVTFETFFENLKSFFIKEFDIALARDFRPDEIDKINTLSIEKYRQFEWNFGYAPDYEYDTSFQLESSVLKLRLKIVKGKFFAIEPKEKHDLFAVLSASLLGKTAEYDAVVTVLKKLFPKKSSIAINQMAFELL